jgi:transposase
MCSLTVGATHEPRLSLAGLDGYEVLESQWCGTRFHYTIQPRLDAVPDCPHCGCRKMQRHDLRQRRLAHAPQGCVPVEIAVWVRRYRCPRCGKTHTPAPPGLPRRARLSPALREFLGWICSKLTTPVTLVAQAFRLGWQTVKSCIVPAAPPELSHLRHLCIDEVYRGQRHQFKTILSDALTNTPLGVAEGRGRRPAERLLGALPAAVREQIETLATDFAEGHRTAGYHCLPNVRVVADCFHLVRLGRLAVRASIGRAKPMAQQAYRELRALLSDRASPALGRLTSWLEKWADANGPLAVLRRTVEDWELEIEAYLTTRRSNGPAEVLNRKIALLRRRACGYANQSNFNQRILSIRSSPHL